MVRIIAGRYRSRQLATPEGDETTRPMPGRVKESVFSILRGWFEGARVLDLFSGVGSVGLEAISRGAESVVMVEKDRRIYDLLTRNIVDLGCTEEATAIFGDALGATALLRAPRPVDLVFIDPPYPVMRGEESRERVFEQIRRCREIMADEGFVILRVPSFENSPAWRIEGFDGPEAHQYGPGMWVLLYAPGPAEG